MPEPEGFTLLSQALVDVVLDVLEQIQVQENIGLGNVNNTSDIAKPVSTAQAAAITAAVNAAVATLTAAIALKAPINNAVFTGSTTLGGAPATALHATTKTYVDTVDALKAPINNAVFTGATTLAADPASALQAATKQYVDALGALKAPINNAVFTGTTTLAADPALALQAATKQYVDATVNALLDAANAEQFKGLIDCSGNPNYPVANSGWTYRVSVAGLIGGGSGIAVEVGDRIQCIVDSSAAGNQATVGANWWLTQANVLFSSNGLSLVTAANYAAMRTLLAMTLADITDMSANGRALTATTYASMKTLLTLVKADVGLGNVDNTSDVNKPVSTAQATADALRAPINNALFTGTTTLAADPTLALQAATKQYVDAKGTEVIVVPVWSTDATAPTLGNGTITGKVIRVGPTSLYASVKLTFGSTTNKGTGTWIFTLPAPYNGAATAFCVARVHFNDTGVADYYGDVIMFATLNSMYVLYNGTAVSNTSTPFAFGAGDSVEFCIFLIGP